MKRRTRDLIATFLIILFVIGLAFLLLNTKKPETTEEIAKCIGENSVLYTRLGCHFCEVQEDILGENYQYLNVIDCFFEESKCTSIKETPTWIINNKKYEGVKSIENLQELTGC
ncbi:MAG: hypothetical protein ABIE36_01485 [Candidatus Diapherotrites archaeon]